MNNHIFSICFIGIIADVDSKEQLLKKGEEIGKQAKDALEMLKSQHRNREVRHLEKDIPLLNELMQTYRNLMMKKWQFLKKN